jgi:hypothetical protein
MSKRGNIATPASEWPPIEATPREASSTELSADDLAPYAEDRDQLLAFCHRHGLLLILRTAVELAQRFFKPSSLRSHVERDPETGEEWIVVRVTVPAKPDQVRNAYRSYTREWARMMRGPERFLVRLSYDLA